jgi:hypothetical protein
MTAGIAGFLKYFVWIALVLAGVLIFRTIFRRGPLELTAQALPARLRKFMISHDNGGRCAFYLISDPNAVMHFTRKSGTDTSCDLIVDVMRTSLTENKARELSKSFDWWKLTPLVPEDEPNVLLRVELNVPDFWDGAAGSVPAGIARKVFEVLGFGRTTRLGCSISGPVSRRMFKRIHDLTPT